MEQHSQVSSQPRFEDLQGTWLISFADLITLLLCAFLMFFSMTWNKPTPGGIQIAPKVKESQEVNPSERRIKLRFTREEVDVETGKLTEAALEKVKSLVKTEAYKSSVATLSSCSERGSQTEGVVTEQALIRQLVDAGVSAKQLVTRFVGSDCSLLGEAERVTIDFERT